MKIAIFGGSFNPVHIEHINIVKAVLNKLPIDKVIIMPSHITPAKTGTITADGADRLAMCRLAFGGIRGVEVSDFEMKKGGVSYSYRTCLALKEKYPGDELYFIMGADMLENFPHWKNPEQILRSVTLAVCDRENSSGIAEAEKRFKEHFNADILKIGYSGAAVSSTEIRTRAALGESIENFVALEVAEYIDKNSLYSLIDVQRIKKYLTEERWAHTVRVAVMAAENCRRLGIPESKAIIASALHDCAKYLKPDSPELSGFTRPEGVPEPVVHQYAGAFVAERIFGIDDEEILDAIRYHTSGKENMAPLGKLIFLCDMLECGRDFDGVKKLREIFSHSIDEALYAALERQVVYLKNTGKPVYPLTQRAYEYIKENKK